jgi:type 1 glutamine amidotransferase
MIAIGLITSTYFLNQVRWLPWQKPVFDTKLTSQLPIINDNGVLIFSKTNGFRHSSIEAGIQAITGACVQKGWQVYATENGAIMDPQYLRSFKVIVFLSTTGNILNRHQKHAFENFIENGGGYVGIHSASDTEHEWHWYGQLIGTFFSSHTLFPEHTPKGTLLTENRNHLATKDLPAHWTKEDEWYNFKQNVRGKKDFEVLVSVQPNSYKTWWPAQMKGDHPISWTHQLKNGRMFYTAIGHTSETFNDTNAMKHIMGGIEWAGKLKAEN